jgi:hypothetical protein
MIKFCLLWLNPFADLLRFLVAPFCHYVRLLEIDREYCERIDSTTLHRKS